MATKSARVHRFRDSVALSLPGEGGTVYMTPAAAVSLARSLAAAAADIGATAFTQSGFVPVEIDPQAQREADAALVAAFGRGARADSDGGAA